MARFFGSFLISVAAVACLTAPARSQQQPILEPEPSWITPAAIPTSNKPDTGAVRMLLSDTQIRFGATADEAYRRSVYKIVTPQGLGAGAIAMNWNPETEDLKVHKLEIRRGDQVINVLSRQDFLVLRRETNLQFAMLNGVLTATLQPEGLKVGDIVDISTTNVRRDPVMQGRSEDIAIGLAPGPVDRLRIRASWDNNSPMIWRASPDLVSAKVQQVGGQTEVLLDLTDAQPIRPPVGAPPRYQFARLLEWSEFKSWAEVSALFAPLYETAAKLNPDSELRAEIDKIKAVAKTPEARASAALALVQEQVRYVFLGMELGGLRPAEVDRTWSRRFGDCKGKTALLLALLRELGIEAEPALVSTRWGDGLDARLPRVGHFDHVIVRATIAGRTYWLDGTRSGDGPIATLTTPPFLWALPVRRSGAVLEKLTLQPLAAPELEQTLELDATAGLEAAAPARAEVIMRGDMASVMRFGLASMPATEAESALKDYWSGLLAAIEPKIVSHDYNLSRGELVLKMEGTAKMDWVSGWGRQVYEIDGASLGGTVDVLRDEGPNKDAPFEVLFPYFTKNRTLIKLPDQGSGFTTRGDDVDKVVGGFEYKRRTQIANGILTMETTSRSIQAEFPASDAAAVKTALADLAKARVFVVAPASTPTTVQGVMALATGGGQGLTDAIAALSKMIEASPQRADFYSLRSQLHTMNSNRAEARKDIDKTIELQPDIELHYLQRARTRDVADVAGRRADIATALRLQPNSADTLAAAASLESEASNHEQALAYLDTAVGLRPGDPFLLIERGTQRVKVGKTPLALEDFAKARASIGNDALMLNQLCWAKVTMNVSLETALEDCNASLVARPDYAPALDSRGLVELRLGQLDKAIASYDEALKISPRMSASLFGRGIAKIRKGLKTEGEADLEAARKVSPTIDKRFAGFGITP